MRPSTIVRIYVCKSLQIPYNSYVEYYCDVPCRATCIIFNQPFYLVFINDCLPPWSSRSIFFLLFLNIAHHTQTVLSATAPSPQTAHFCCLYSVFFFSIFTFNVKKFKIYNPHRNRIERRFEISLFIIFIYLINFGQV